MEPELEARVEAKRIAAAKKRKETLAKPRGALLFEVAYRCLIGGESVAEVTRRLGIARSFCTELLTEASDPRNAIIIPKQVFLRSPDDLQKRVEAVLRDRFKLEHVRVVPTPADDRAIDSPEYRAEVRRQLGWAVADLV